MDGVKLLSLLRGRGNKLPAIFITSTPTRGLRELVAGMSACIVEKPLLGTA